MILNNITPIKWLQTLGCSLLLCYTVQASNITGIYCLRSENGTRIDPECVLNSGFSPVLNETCVVTIPQAIDLDLAPKEGLVVFCNDTAPYELFGQTLISGTSSSIALSKASLHMDEGGNEKSNKKAILDFQGPAVVFHGNLSLTQEGRMYVFDNSTAIIKKWLNIDQSAEIRVESESKLHLHGAVNISRNGVLQFDTGGIGVIHASSVVEISGKGSQSNIRTRIDMFESQLNVEGRLHIKEKGGLGIREGGVVRVTGEVELSNNSNNRNRESAVTIIGITSKKGCGSQALLEVGNRLILNDNTAIVIAGGRIDFKEGAVIVFKIDSSRGTGLIDIEENNPAPIQGVLNILLVFDHIYVPPDSAYTIISFHASNRVDAPFLDSPGYAVSFGSRIRATTVKNHLLWQAVRLPLNGGYVSLATSIEAKAVAERVDSMVNLHSCSGLTNAEQNFLSYLDLQPTVEDFNKVLEGAGPILDGFDIERTDGIQMPEFININVNSNEDGIEEFSVTLSFIAYWIYREIRNQCNHRL